MDCEEMPLFHKGKCKNNGPCNCNDNYEPVCSKTYRMYQNLCKLECANEKLLKKGSCYWLNRLKNFVFILKNFLSFLFIFNLLIKILFMQTSN